MGGEIGPSVLRHGQEVEFDFGGRILRETGLNGGFRELQPRERLFGVSGVRFRRRIAVFGAIPAVSVAVSVATHPHRTGLQPIQFVQTPVFSVGHEGHEMKDILVFPFPPISATTAGRIV